MGLALIGVIGAATRADAYVCTAALGCGYTGNHYATAAGDSGAVGYDSVAMGSGCWAYGTGAVAMGVESTATGGVSFAMGWYPTASGYVHPVSFTYRSSGQHSFGFIAEEVAEIYPDFAVYDEQGRPESVRYAEMTALLANAVQELSAETQELAATVKTQAVALSEQSAQLKAQASELAGLRASVAKQQLLLETLAADVARLSR
jgi:hypothetical protein